MNVFSEAIFTFALILFLLVAVRYAYNQYVVSSRRSDYHYAYNIALAINESMNILYVNESLYIYSPYPITVDGNTLRIGEAVVYINATGHVRGSTCILVRNGEVRGC